MAFPPLVNSNLRSNETGGPGTHGHGSCALSSSEVSYDDTGTTTGTSTVTPTGTTSSGSKTISSLSSVTGIQVGSAVSGSGVPSGTTVTAVSASHSTVTISKSATSSHSHVTLTFTTTTTTSNTSTDPTASGSYTYTVVPLENSYATRLGEQVAANNSRRPARRRPEHVEQLQPAGALDLGYLVRDGDRPGAGGARCRERLEHARPRDRLPRRRRGELRPDLHVARRQSRQPVPVDAVPTGGRFGGRGRGADHLDDGHRAGRHHDLCDRLLGEHERPGHQLQRRRRDRQPRSQLQRRHGQLRPDVRLLATRRSSSTVSETAAAGTTDPAGCDSESRPITGCWTIAHIASDPSTFFQDPSDTDITTIFNQIASDLTAPRLFPDNTQ